MSCRRGGFGVVLARARGRVPVSAFRRVLLFSVTVCALGLGPVSVSWGDVNQHAAIVINGNDPTESFAKCECATGSGTKTDPYVIGPWAITSENSTSGAAVAVENVTADFTITGISANYTDTDHPSHAVIYLSNVHPTDSAMVSNVSANEDGTGVEIDSSSNITLSSVSVNKMNGTGLRILDSNHITSINGKYKATHDELAAASHNADGLYAAGSDHLQIGGVPGCPSKGICNTFDYDSGWGIYLGPDPKTGQPTSVVTIDNASANADDTGGYILDGTSGVTLENSTAEAGGPICISLNGGKEPSGYSDTGLLGNLVLFNGASGNTIENDTFSGYETGVGYDIAEAPNPFYNSPCGGRPIQTSSGSVSGVNDFVQNTICYTTSFVPTSVPPLPPLPRSDCKS